MKFKVGDKVIANKNGASRGKNEPYMKGKEYTLRYVFKDDTVGLEGFDNICEKADFDLKPTSIFDGLIEGEYYHFDSSKGITYIFKHLGDYSKDTISSKYLWVEDKCFNSMSNNFTSKESLVGKTKPATPEEIEWLDACIAAGKYVDKPEKWVPQPGDWCFVKETYISSEIKKGRVFKFIEWQSRMHEFALLEHDGKNSYLAPPLKHLRKALPHEIPKQESNHLHDVLGYMCRNEIREASSYTVKLKKRPIDLDGTWDTQPSNNLTPDKNEHKTEKFEVQRPNFSIPTASAGRGERFDRPKSKVRFGSDDCHYQKGSSTSEKGFRKR